jgi:hypothetical protein
MRLLISALIIPTLCFSQPLAQIKTKEQAANFIKENFKYYKYKYDFFEIDSLNSDFDNFKEGDFNHDGIADLLVFGKAHVDAKSTTFEQEEIIILMGDKKKLKKVKFPYSFFGGFGDNGVPRPKVISIEQKDYVLIKYEVFKQRQPPTTFYDTLFIMNDHVIPFAKTPSDKEVTRIDFKTDRCFGTCPVFEMTIDKNFDVEYNGLEFVDKKGKYKLRINTQDWDYITSLIRNLKIEDLKDNYSIDWTDHQTAFLTVVFKDGTKKNITDYGLAGTFGLAALYDYFFELSKF